MAAILAVLFVALMLTSKSEKFVEAFGFSGHSAPNPPVFNKEFDASGYKEEAVTVTRNQMQKIIQSVMKEMKLCDAYPLETNYVHLLQKGGVDPIYRCHFTFMAKDGGFPVGIGVQSDVIMNDNGARVVGLTTQPAKGPGGITPFDPTVGAEYTGFEMISKNNIPNMNALEQAKNSLLK